ncbi:MAG TPA: PorP/SprF family type IX secretion system membrane protein [Crocinitomicaceae bacterium]|nr:PorP/SprF family type IX secretion system membrane protein [Crocinitomicaceae bacterium]
MRLKLRKYFVIGCVALAFNTSKNVYAQDVHFSQAYYSPLNLNPALVGIDNSITAIANFRTQWKAVATPYNTIGFSVDGRLNENKRDKKGIFAMGLNFYNDQSGDVRISTTTASVNFGYHLIINNKNTIGAAIYGGFGNRFINTAAGKWGSQFNGLVYDASLPTNEYFMTDRFSYMDVGVGVVYRYRSSESYMSKNDGKQFTAGFSVYHLNKPNFSFINTNDDKLYMRFSAFANAMIGFDNSNVSLMPAIYFQKQGPSNEILFGTYGRYAFQNLSSITGFNKGILLSLGLFYRAMDAMVVKMMFEWNDFTLGVSYDVNMSTLTPASNARGGMEFFLKYGLTKGYAGRASKVGKRSKI